jgi:WhiB family redox-sensing transcriptional regulator
MNAIESEAAMTIAVDNLAEWWSLAACQSVDPDLFFPMSTTNPSRAEVAAAKTVCARCPVQAECLEYALGAGQLHGIWGGMNEEERRRASARVLPARAHRGPGRRRGLEAAFRDSWITSKSKEGRAIYIGIGTVVLIVIIVLIVMLLRR